MYKKYLITGGCGFTGSNFAEKLLEAGHQVHVTDNLSRRGAAENLKYLKSKYPQVQFTHLDLRLDSKVLHNLVAQSEMIFHLAAQVTVTNSITNPREDFESNICATFNLLEAIRNSQSRPALIYSSTNKVYGSTHNFEVSETAQRYQYKNIESVDENAALDFHTPYGCSKGAADQYVRDYSRIYNLDTVVMRQSCIYGPRQFGVEDQGWVAWFIIAALTKKPLTLYGNGKQVRDLLYIDDLFAAWMQAAQKMDQVKGQIFNVGGGPEFSLSLLELISYLENQLNQKLEYSFQDSRPGDSLVYISDISKIKKTLDWQPTVPPMQGIGNLLKWVQDNIQLF